MINLANRNELESFVNDNIKEYNTNKKGFDAKHLNEEIKKQLGLKEDALYTSSDIGVYLSEKFDKLLQDPEEKKKIDSELNAISGAKNIIDDKLRDLSNLKVISFDDLKNYYEILILKRIQNTFVSNANYQKSIIKKLLDYNNYALPQNKSTSDQIDYINKDISSALSKSLYLAIIKGFNNNNVGLYSGTKMANDGDSAQFLFLARAILAGFNCSNVDVRSSRYDAVIDFEGHLLRVQVKGISGTSIALKDRDRGGAGIDPSARRNKGKVFSSADTDIYAAVDKQFGLVYLVPAKVIDVWVSEGKSSIAISKLDEYKENWAVIAQVTNDLFK